MTDSLFPKHLGRYEIVREIGYGAMGVVYEGRDPKLGRRVALKTARRELMSGPTASPDALARFFREARVAASLNHPGIITVYDAGEQDGTAYMAMEFIDGCDLGARIAQGPPLSVHEAVELVGTLAGALDYAHARGVVHRDIKPANIMLPRQGPPKLADFGIARVVDSTLTQQGALIGTPTYMSPEQFMGQAVDGRSDLFSLSAVLYELLTGERPFAGAAFSTIMHHVINTSPVPPHELNFAVNESLSRAVMAGLSKAPQNRPPTGSAFAATLRTAAGTVSEAPVFHSSEEETLVMPAEASPDAVLQTRKGGSDILECPGVSSADGKGGTTVLDSTDSPLAVAQTHKTSERPVLAGAAGLVLVLVAGFLIYNNRFREQAPAVPAEPPAANVLLETPADPVDHPKLRVNVYATANDRDYLEYQHLFNARGDTAGFIRDALAAGRIEPLRGAGYSVVVYDSRHPGEPFSTETLTEDGYALLSLPENSETIRFEVRSGPETLLVVELSSAVCAVSQNLVVPCPKCLPNRGVTPTPAGR